MGWRPTIPQGLFAFIALLRGFEGGEGSPVRPVLTSSAAVRAALGLGATRLWAYVSIVAHVHTFAHVSRGDSYAIGCGLQGRG